MDVWEYLSINLSSYRKYYFDTGVSFYELEFSDYNSIITNPLNLATGDWIVTYNTYLDANLIFESKYMKIYQK